MPRRVHAPIYWRSGRAYLDARVYSDVGGGQERLVAPGERLRNGTTIPHVDTQQTLGLPFDFGDRLLGAIASAAGPGVDWDVSCLAGKKSGPPTPKVRYRGSRTHPGGTHTATYSSGSGERETEPTAAGGRARNCRPGRPCAPKQTYTIVNVSPKVTVDGSVALKQWL